MRQVTTAIAIILLLIPCFIGFTYYNIPTASAAERVHHGSNRLALTRITEVKDYYPTEYNAYGVVTTNFRESLVVMGDGAGNGGAKTTFTVDLGYYRGDIDKALIEFSLSWSVENAECVLTADIYYKSKERPFGEHIKTPSFTLDGKDSADISADVTEYALIPPPPQPGYEVDKKVVIEISLRYSGSQGGKMSLIISPVLFKIRRAPSLALSHEMYPDEKNESRILHEFKLQPIRYSTEQWSRVMVSIYFISYYRFVELYRSDTGKRVDTEGWTSEVETIEYEGKTYEFNVIRRVNPFGPSAEVRLTLVVESDNYIAEAGVRSMANRTIELLQRGETFFLYAANVLNYTDYEILSGDVRWKWGRLELMGTKEVELKNGEEITVNIFYNNFTIDEVPNIGTWTIRLTAKDDYNVGYRTLEIRVYDPAVVGSIDTASNALLSGNVALLNGPEWKYGCVFLVDPSRLVAIEDFAFEEEPGLSVTSATLINRVYNLKLLPQIRFVIYNNGNETVTLPEMKIYIECAGFTSTGTVKFSELGESDVFTGRATRAYLLVVAPFNETPIVTIASGQTGAQYNVSMTPIEPLQHYYRPKLIVVKIGLGEKVKELPFMFHDPWGIVRGRLISYKEATVSPLGSASFQVENINLYGARKLDIYFIAHGEGFITTLDKVFNDVVDFDYKFTPLELTGKPGELKTIRIKLRSRSSSLTLSFTIQLLYGHRDFKKAMVLASEKITLAPGEERVITVSFTMPRAIEDAPEIIVIYSPELDYMFKWIALSWEEPMEWGIGENTVSVPKLIEVQGLPTLYINTALIAFVVFTTIYIIIKIALFFIRPK